MQRRGGRVLLVDDDAAVVEVLAAVLRQAGFEASCARSGTEALSLLERQAVDLVLSDVRMPGMDGLALLRRVVRAWPELPVVLLTAHGSVPLAVEAMKAGASDFLLKPFERDEVLFVVQKALLGAERAQERAPRACNDASSLIGFSAAMAGVRELIERAAATRATVLITGETGTGKDLVARCIHERSQRASAPFVALNCAALPENLIESELFGYEKGAFTGAACRKPGRAELAAGGTLFLDEIGDVPLATQVKLLRLLQNREFERLGSVETVQLDVRFMAATHRDLKRRIAEGKFREDLFYRLNVIPIRVPPLRERREDIAALVAHFAVATAKANAYPPVDIDGAACQRLTLESWPGNVRQLENFVERLIVLGDGPTRGLPDVERELARVAPDASAAQTSTDRGSVRLEEQRREAEREAVSQALLRANNNRSLAARLLGISRRTLYNKLEELGMSPAVSQGEV